jgi:hypothetical protein
MKKLITLIAGLLIALSSIQAFAAFTDVPDQMPYSDAVRRVAALGIINGTGTGLYKPDNILSREQFAKIIVAASGFEEEAAASKGSTPFPDVEKGSVFSGYINVAVKNGYISGMNDGKFHPKDPVNFAQACTVIVKVLGTAGVDYPLEGQWPDNYIAKAKSIGATDGITLKKNDKLPRWAAAMIVDKLWINKVKSGAFGDITEIFGDNPGIFTECIIYATSATSSSLTAKQVLTDKGILSLYDSKTVLDVGFRYKLINDGNTIIKECGKSNTVKKITVDSIAGDDVTYMSDGKPVSLTLPLKPVYYYNGTKQNYADLANIIFHGSTISFGYDKNNTDFDYAVITDPQGSNLGRFTEAIILGNAQTHQNLISGQIMTDKGIFYLSDTGIMLELGNKYGLIIKDDVIVKVNEKLKSVINITVDSSNENTVVYKDGSSTNSLVLPASTIYYYNGLKQNYSTVNTLLKANSSIILAKSGNTAGYEYAVIIDPIYSKPAVAYNYNVIIDFNSRPTILKNGFVISQGDINEKDVVYTVTDIWGKNGYVLVIDNKIFGAVENVYPDVLNPSGIKLLGDNTIYKISKFADLNTIKSLRPNDIVFLLRGYDGSVVDVRK